MGKSSQRKGADGEKELVDLLQSYGYNVYRGGSLAFGNAPDIVGLPGIHIEVKRVEKLNLDAAMLQAKRDAERFHDGSPTVFHRKNRGEWLVTMPLEEWMKLYVSIDRKGLT